MQLFPGFSAEILRTLDVPGITERWNAVQTTLHPVLVQLAEQISQQMAQLMPRQWPLYERSYRNLRFTNRGPQGHTPIDSYHLAIDRPPRGSGVFIAVSGSERRIVIAIQLGRARKSDLRQIWEEGRAIWQPLVEHVTDVRFVEPQPHNRRPSEPRELLDDPQTTKRHPNWMDRYLQSRASYLLFGFSYHWDDPQVAQPAFADQIINHIASLLPLNEALMEQAESRDPAGAALLREQRISYTSDSQPNIEQVIERINQGGFSFDPDLIRAYHIALHTRPLVILPGISGSGKTRLTRRYADAWYADHGISSANPYYLLVAVQPDWHNNRDLLGYYNTINGKFQPTPFLRFANRAAADPANLYFVCLDEMNLARPEYYLAPILSALETDQRMIDLGAPTEQVTSVSGELFSNPFRLPANLRLIGTVNVDESAHALSDKLLDRANVIELIDVDLDRFRANYPGVIDPAIWQVIVQSYTIVARAGHPFGYRTISAILAYVEQAQGVLPAQRALDLQLKQKILPKLRGDDQPRLRRALTELLELALGITSARWGRAGQITPAQLAAAPLPATATKLQRMLERLDNEGMTDFYG